MGTLIDTKVDTRALKDFANREFRDYPLVRKIILQEPDQMPTQEFVIKSKIWLQLLAEERQIEDSRGIRLLHNRLIVRQ